MALMSAVDWAGTRTDQIEGVVLRETKVRSPIVRNSSLQSGLRLVALQNIAVVIAPFCTSPKTEVALINVVQTFCYEDTKFITTRLATSVIFDDAQLSRFAI